MIFTLYWYVYNKIYIYNELVITDYKNNIYCIVCKAYRYFIVDRVYYSYICKFQDIYIYIYIYCNR